MSIEAMKQMIELYDKRCYNNDYGGIEFNKRHGYKFNEAIEALRTAIQQAESAEAQTKTDEPVGEAGEMPGEMPWTNGFTVACFKKSQVPAGTKLYTQPAPGEPTLITKQQVMYALAFVPLDLSHPAKCQWIAEALTAAQAQKGK